MGSIVLFHTGFDTIREPDIRYGRTNADFGQGFYLCPDRDFSERWAKSRKGKDTVINTYRLETYGLKIKQFGRDEEWFSYIRANRRGQKDSLAEYDVITGPIANDTIYDTWGIFTSGLIPDGQVMAMLGIGPAYEQTVIKTEKALSQLSWQTSEIISPDKLESFRERVRSEQEEYQAALAAKMLEFG
ncbi:MAG: DUF3990 domain-containing protein [Lachnospiraceae bacterium]|nr:DUF3990 domain-containing protein [Lachnospiraceae bacterium]